MRQTEQYSVTLLQAHKETLQRLSEASGEKMSVVVRRLIREEGQRRGVWPGTAASAGGQEVRHA